MEISAFSHPSVDYLFGQVDCLVVVLVERVVIELVADFVQVAFELVAGFVDLKYLLFYLYFHLSFLCLFSQTNLKIIDPRIKFFW
jgi:phage-related holin